jgi:hypothetical protein
VTRALRLALVLLLAVTTLAVIPGEAAAVVSGELGRIVFVSDTSDPTGDIYIRDFAGSNPKPLAASSEPEFSPRWSPDGSRIAYAQAYGGPGGSDVFVIDPDGSDLKNLSKHGPGGSTSIPLDWSPDGLWILFRSDRGGQGDLWVMRPDGSDPKKLTSTADTESHASWSPDGSMIAFESNDDIWLMDADGSNQRALVARPREDDSPTWSPDGNRIAFESSFVGDRDIWVVAADGSGVPANLTNTPSYRNTDPRWSPDGTLIAFTSNRDGDLDLWMMNSRGSDVGHLTNAPSGEWDMDWESVNRPPVAVDDQVTVRQCGMVTIDYLANDFDPDGEPLVETDLIGPMAGSVGSDGAGNTIYIEGCPGFPKPTPYTDSFDYRIEDPRGGSDWATVTISVYSGFDDVPSSHLFSDDINWLADQGITRGCNPPQNNLFCPDDFVTRGQMAAFLVRALHYTDGAGADLFVDDNGSVFEDDIDRLGTAGVTAGCNPPVNDRFCPNGLVTRGQMAAFLARAFKLTNLGMVDLFVDDNNSIFEADIDKLGATGVSRGCNPPTNDRFCPTQNVTRAQMAAFIRRAVDYIS